MKYSEARSKIKAGDMLAWSHRKWASWYDFKVQAVRIFTRSEYCHVAVAWPVAGRVFILEAVMPKIRIYPLSKELPFYWLPMNANWTDAAEEFALSHVGDPYSQFQAMQAAIDNLKIGSDNIWECAEFTMSVLKQAGVNLNCLATPSAGVLNAQTLGAPLYLVTPD